MNLPTPKRVKDAVLLLKQASIFVAECDGKDLESMTLPRSFLRSKRVALVIIETGRG